MEKPDSRPTFVALKSIFNSYARAPAAVVVVREGYGNNFKLSAQDAHSQRPGTFEVANQNHLIEEIIDTDEFADPQTYLDSVPSTPMGEVNFHPRTSHLW